MRVALHKDTVPSAPAEKRPPSRDVTRAVTAAEWHGYWARSVQVDTSVAWTTPADTVGVRKASRERH